jgi:hypothetical protein
LRKAATVASLKNGPAPGFGSFPSAAPADAASVQSASPMNARLKMRPLYARGGTRLCHSVACW